MTVELTGPKVNVTRAGSADRGAGQLVIAGATLVVRVRHIERRLGMLATLEHVRVLDLARRHAELCFTGGVVWDVQSENGELFTFLKQVEATTGRPGLISDPPRLSQRVLQAATPEHKLRAFLTVVAIAMAWPLRVLCALSSGLAYAVAALGLLGLLGCVITLGTELDEPPWIPALRRRLQRLGAVPLVALCLALALSGVLGGLDAKVRAHDQTVRARVAAMAATAARHRAERDARAAREKKARIDTLVDRLRAALEAKSHREAGELRDALVVEDPKHPLLGAIGASLDTQLAQLDEEARLKGLREGLRAVHRMAKDSLPCETFKTVADAWAHLRKVRASDPEHDQVVKALGTLERCRARVVQRTYQSMLDGARQQLPQNVQALEARLKREGFPVALALEGGKHDQLVVRHESLDAAVVARITALPEPPAASFLDARAREGVRVLAFTGTGFEKRFELTPPSAAELTAPVLASAGLDQPLSLTN